MSQILLKTVVLRTPEPHAPARPTEPAIHTHFGAVATGVVIGSAWPAAVHWPWRDPGAAAKPGTSPLHNRLFAAWQARDWTQLVTAARAQLGAGGPRATPALHAFSSAAVEFFRPQASAIAAHDVEQFLGSLPKDQLKVYAAATGVQDRNTLADHALALHCLGALGGATFNPIAGLRALMAFAVAAAPFTAGETRVKPQVMHAIREVLAATVCLPWWSFHLDPCADPAKRGDPAEKTTFELKLERLQRFRLGPAGEGNCDCSSDAPSCAPQNPCCATIRYYVADLLELRSWTHRYKAGDLAYIEVVAAGEKRMRKHEMRRTKETFAEEVSTTRSLEKRDQQVSDRSSLQREIERQNSATSSASASATAGYNAEVYSASLTASYSADRSASDALKEVQQSARELVTNAVSEIEKEVRTTRSERVTTEDTEKNLHSFSNVDGLSPKVTKYFWVTQERRAQLFSYDKRLHAEFIVPEPARLFEHLLMVKREAIIAKEILPPKGAKPLAPAAIPFGAGDLNAANYLQHAADYGVANPPAPPAATQNVSVSTSDQTTRKGNNPLAALPIQVPPGYYTTGMSLSGGVNYRTNNYSPHRVEFDLGGQSVRFQESLSWLQATNSDVLSSGLPGLTGSLSIDVIANNTNSFSATITLSLAVDAATMAAWRQSVFKLIQEVQDSRVKAYETALEAWEIKQDEYLAAQNKLRRELIAKEGARSPFANLELQRTELKRAVIYLMCQDFSPDGALIPKAEPCGYPEIDRMLADEKGYDWYFWDRLFDWKHIGYAFFDYFWNPMCAWPDRLDPNEPDAMFKAFRRAGYARVMVPVSPNMENDFLWYVSTGEKWGQAGHAPWNPLDPRWRNVVYELQYASDSAMTAREGFVADVAPGDTSVLIKDSNRYWDPALNGGAGGMKQLAVDLDTDRELLIDGAIYQIADVQLDPNSPPYDPALPNTMWWRVTLDRPYEGPAAPRRLYSTGPKAVAPVFSFDMPTDLIWAGAHDECLPTYPLPPCPG